MMPLLIVLLIALIAFSVGNLLSLRDLKKFNRSNRVLKDDRYYELKYKIEYVTTFAVVVISVGAFFGYKWFEEIKKDASDNLKAVTEKYDIRLDSIGKQIDSKRFTLNENGTMQSSLDKRIETSESRLLTLSKKIDIINNKSIVKQDIYLVDKIVYNHTKGETDTCRFYYRDLKSIKGEDLPVFDKPPFLTIATEGGFALVIVEKTKDYFILIDIGWRFGSGLVTENSDKDYFGIMVSQK